MASIRKRVNKSGVVYTAAIRIRRKGEIVYQESQTFGSKEFDNPKVAAQKWAKRREVELDDEQPWRIKSDAHSLSVSEALVRYVQELEAGAGIGRTKRSCMLKMARYELFLSLKLSELSSADVMTFLRDRSSEGISGATVAQDAIYLKVLAEYASIAWGVEADLVGVDNALKMAARVGLVARATKRDRRPTLEELDLILSYFSREYGVRGSRGVIPMQTIILFLLFSARRVGEAMRIRWSDLDEKNQRVLVRDMKHPRKKKGNDVWVYLPDRAFQLLMDQKREGDVIFPYDERSVSAAFRRAWVWTGVRGLTLHDFRHEGISHLFELQWDIPRVAMVSGHATWDSLRRYTHLSGVEEYDKYAGWRWLDADLD